MRIWFQANFPPFDKQDSFDRLFPNQDLLSGKGFGNLIALPLQGQSRKQQKTVFLDPANQLTPFTDQWEFLRQVKRISPIMLDELYNKFNRESKIYTKLTGKSPAIVLKNQVIIQKKNLPGAVAGFLVVHKKQIYNQWLERIEHFLAIPKRERWQNFASFTLFS